MLRGLELREDPVDVGGTIHLRKKRKHRRSETVLGEPLVEMDGISAHCSAVAEEASMRKSSEKKKQKLRHAELSCSNEQSSCQDSEAELDGQLHRFNDRYIDSCRTKSKKKHAKNLKPQSSDNPLCSEMEDVACCPSLVSLQLHDKNGRYVVRSENPCSDDDTGTKENHTAVKKKQKHAHRQHVHDEEACITELEPQTSCTLPAVNEPVKKKRKRSHLQVQCSPAQSSDGREIGLQQYTRGDDSDERELEDYGRTQQSSSVGMREPCREDGCEEDDPSVGQADNGREERSAAQQKRKTKKRERQKLNFEAEQAADRVTDGTEESTNAVSGIITVEEDSNDKLYEGLSDNELVELLLHRQCTRVCRKSNMAVIRNAAEKLRVRGITVATGQWTHHEMEQLRTNFANYKSLYPAASDDVVELLRGVKHLPRERQLVLQRLAVDTNLYPHLARGVCRSLWDVYVKARHMFHGARSGSFTAKETSQLIQLVDCYGRNWSLIGSIMNRSRMSCHRRYRSVPVGQEKFHSGEWTTAEDQVLMQAVDECIKKHGIEQPYYDLPWKEVAAQVKTRSSDRCRDHWLSFACFLYTHNGEKRRHFNAQDQLRLLELVYCSGASEESQIDWHDLMDNFDNVVSPQQLRQLWFVYLKSKVPQHAIRTFEEICDYLQTVHAPALREKH